MACYCNALIVVHKYPDHVFESIRGEWFNIKETSEPDYFTGGYFERVKETKTNNKILIWGSKKFVKCMMDNFKKKFGSEPSNQHGAMPPDYNPELDTTELCTDTEKSQYWKFIGETQWADTLGLIDIMYATDLFHPKTSNFSTRALI